MFFSFFLIIGWCFAIPTGVEQVFKSILGLVISIGIPIKEAKAKIETHPVIAEANRRNCSI